MNWDTSEVYIIFFFIIIFIGVLLWYFASPGSFETVEPILEDSFPFPILIVNLDRKPERFTYVKEQLDNMGLTGYQRISGTDGFFMSREELAELGTTYELTEHKGLAGCAASHIRAWRHIVENKMGWTLILEDDAHFHPQFLKLFSKYWNNVPVDAKIVFPGFCADVSVERSHSNLVIQKQVMCLQGYILSSEGAQYLLNNILPINEPIDIVIDRHFKNRRGSYIFNGNVTVDGIRPNDYKEANGRRCMFNGIIYQNHEEQGSTIHNVETVF
jgi:glycosyl transferase family 25